MMTLRAIKWSQYVYVSDVIATRLNSFAGATETADPFAIEKNTHLWLLFQAVSLIEGESASGRHLHNLIQPCDGIMDDDFRDSLCQALADADNKAPYNNPIVKVFPTWRSHFYDPDTGTNWMNQTNPTALTEGSRFYEASQRAYHEKNWGEAGYNFGLALHYITDLTQPMHAANFTYLDSQRRGYHNDFERYAKSILHRIEPPRVYAPLLDSAPYRGFFHAVARYTKDHYYAIICQPKWTRNYSTWYRDGNLWDERIGSILPVILSDAIQHTAQFLLMWHKDATR